MVSAHGNSAAQKWNFLGQESNEELGLNWLTFRYRNYMPELGRFFGVDPVSSEYMSISTFQFAHNNPIWKIEIEGLEGQEKQGKDVEHHEPVKVIVKTNAAGVTGGIVATKTIQTTTKKAAIELSKSYIDDAGKLVLDGTSKSGIGGKALALAGKALGVIAMVLTPGKLGNGNKPDSDLKIDEKLQVDSPILKPEDQKIEDSPIRRFDSDDNVSFLMGDSERGDSTKGKAKLFTRKGGLGHAIEAFHFLNPENVRELDDGSLIGTLPDGRKVNVRPRSSDGRPTLEIQDGKKRIKFRFDE